VADPKGFLKVTEREVPKRRPVPIRLMDWKEVYEAADPSETRRQAGATTAARSAT
jgi:glutamate synthase (NADPH/NADH) small chain